MRWLILSVGMILTACQELVIWDCTDNSKDMAAWVDGCLRSAQLSTCTMYAQEIFCKPYTVKDTNEAQH